MLTLSCFRSILHLATVHARTFTVQALSKTMLATPKGLHAVRTYFDIRQLFSSWGSGRYPTLQNRQFRHKIDTTSASWSPLAYVVVSPRKSTLPTRGFLHKLAAASVLDI
jgi:hypothetical protein